jgi:peptidyl-prolyl cis-trans isomerase-like 3
MNFQQSRHCLALFGQRSLLYGVRPHRSLKLVFYFFYIQHDVRGIVSMANKGPNTNGSQFFITYGPQPHLDLKFTVFGKVIDGLQTLDELEKLPVHPKNCKPIGDTRILSVTIHANPLAG